jgi:hypothetical protein
VNKNIRANIPIEYKMMIGNRELLKAEKFGVTTEIKKGSQFTRHQESCPTQTRLVLEHFQVIHNFATAFTTNKVKKRPMYQDDNNRHELTRNLTTPERNKSLVEPEIIKQ